MLATPVLLIVFNRPSIAQKSFEQIRKVKPKQLFIAADGPRPNKPSDVESCAATREIINQIDWPCDLKTLFRDYNRGCGRGPAEAITWFFEHVEEGIVLEDDCLPTEGFFSFCAELLEHYRTDESIALISGTNPIKRWKSTSQSYIYSAIGSTWGWASWRRAWKNFDYSAAAWKTEEGKERVTRTLKSNAIYKHFAKEFEHGFAIQKEDVWDLQWYFCRLYEQSYSLVPTVSLVSNIGFGEEATHTFYAPTNHELHATGNLKFPLKHFSNRIDTLYDWVVFERFYNTKKRSLLKKVLLKTVEYFYLA